jgi:hypothetical protein
VAGVAVVEEEEVVVVVVAMGVVTEVKVPVQQ